MSWYWYAGALLVAAIDWFAVARNIPKVRAFSKAGTMLILIAGYSAAGGWAGDGFWIGVGLVASMLGDIFLLLPTSFFIAGLASFLFAHVCYIIGFNQSLPYFAWQMPLILAVFVLLDIWMYRRLRRVMMTRPKVRWQRYPMLFYILMLSLMVISALLCYFRPEWSFTGASLASLGALFFLVSDSVLANDRFVAPIRYGRVIVIVTYHLAQMLIIAATLQH